MHRPPPALQRKVVERVVCSLPMIVVLATVAYGAGAPARPPHHSIAPSRMRLSPLLPYDVPVALVRSLDAAGRIPEAQRIFDELSWQSFIALNWPADKHGRPDAAKTISDSGPRVWDYWRTADTIFLPRGQKPNRWLAPGTYPASNAATGEPLFRDKAAWRQEADANENFQAFSGPLVDRNGKWVRYEVLVNDVEFNYLFKNGLYNLEGQQAFSQKPSGNDVDFPVNDGTRKHGVIEVKLSWKQLGKNDDPRRFYHTMATVTLSDRFVSDGHGGLRPQTKHIPVGLVGMHISMRTESSPEWIWATFEQVDNCPDKAQIGHASSSRHYNFYSATATGPINTLPPKNATLNPQTGEPIPVSDPTKASTWMESRTTVPVQVARVIPIAKVTDELNAQMQALLRRNQSVFQYYELVGTQWPVHPNAPAVPGGAGSAPDSIVHKTPGDMIPVFLTNMTMETYFQLGTQPAGPLEQDDRLAAGAPPIDNTTVFGTESCVGCHYSAGMAIGFKKNAMGKFILDSVGRRTPIIGENGNFGKNGNAEFSWLLQIEAHSTHDPAPQLKKVSDPAEFIDIGEHPGRHTLASPPKSIK